MTENKLLQDAIKARDNYLKEHPNMIKFQEELDELLDKCIPNDRLAVITMKMMQNMLDLQKECLKLKEILP